MSEKKVLWPFTEDDVTNDFVEAIDVEVVGVLGDVGQGDYEWAGDEKENDGTWPFVVVRDGREFEVDIDVRVTELTPERKAQREATEAAILKKIQALEFGGRS